MKLAGFDIESKGVDVGYALQPFRARTGEAWLTTCAISTTDHGTVGAVRPDKEYLRRFLRAMAERDVTICGWNVPFDMAWLIAMGLRDEVYACKWLDGMMLWRHLTASPEWTLMAPKSYGLKNAVATILPAFAGYDDGIDFDDDSPEGLAKLLEYNKRDALYTVMLCSGFLAEMTDAQRRCALIEAQCLPMAAETMVEGIKGNREKALALSEKLEDASSLAIVNLTVATEKIIDPAVLSSPVKLRDLLFKEWGLKPVKQTAKGADSTDRDALSQLAEVDPRASLLNDYREAKNNRTKFAEGMIKSLDYNGDGYTRPAMKPYGTYTSRATYSSKILRGKDERPTGYPIHQMKRSPEFRDLIEAPDGYTMMEWDFSGQETKWMAVLSGDENMLAMSMPGEDMHAYMGAKLAGMTYDQVREGARIKGTTEAEYRQMGKVGNLACLSRDNAVLTNRGYVFIDDVLDTDLLWDGVEWVRHDGVVYMGIKDVYEYDGVTATLDHKVLVGGNWVEFEKAICNRQRIDTALDFVQSPARETRSLCGDYRRRATSAEARKCHAPAVLEPYQSELQQLRGSGHRVSFCIDSRGLLVDSGELAARRLSRAGYRQTRQQRSLRGGQPATSVTSSKLDKYAHVACVVRGSSVGRDRPVAIPRNNDTAKTPSRYDARTNHRGCTQGSAREAQGVAHYRGKVAVFDILNAGPRHRFTVNNRIVSNCQYRTSASTLERVARVQYGLRLTPQQARAIHGTYRTTYPYVPMYWKRQIELARQRGWVETIAGRRVHVGTEASWTGVREVKGEYVPFDNTWGCESTAINFPIQGSGAEQKYLGLMALRNLLAKYDGRLYYEMHDGLTVVCPDRYAEKLVHEGKHLLSNLPYKKAWGVDFPIQFPVDAKMGKSWGSMKEVE